MDFFLHMVVSTALAYQFCQDENSRRAFILGGIVPDLDVAVAWIPLLIPQLYILEHRGVFHTILLAPFIVCGMIYSTKYIKRINFVQRLDEPFQTISTNLNYPSVIWGVLGVFLHLIMDVISYNGVLLFYPLSSQRISLNIISVVDPLVSVLSSIVVLRLTYNKLIETGTYSFFHFKKSAKMISILFVILLTTYGFLQMYTGITHSPISTKAEIIPLFRWVYTEEQNNISIGLVNQLTQEVVQTYTYPALTYNQTKWNRSTIDLVIDQAKETLAYQEFKFQLESEAYITVNAKFNVEDKKWEVSFLDTFRDAQFRFYGFPPKSFMLTKLTIYLDFVED